MSHSSLRYIGLLALLLVALSVWIIALVLLWILTQLYLDVLSSVIELAQLS